MKKAIRICAIIGAVLLVLSMLLRIIPLTRLVGSAVSVYSRIDRIFLQAKFITQIGSLINYPIVFCAKLLFIIGAILTVCRLKHAYLPAAGSAAMILSCCVQIGSCILAFLLTTYYIPSYPGHIILLIIGTYLFLLIFSFAKPKTPVPAILSCIGFLLLTVDIILTKASILFQYYMDGIHLNAINYLSTILNTLGDSGYYLAMAVLSPVFLLPRPKKEEKPAEEEPEIIVTPIPSAVPSVPVMTAKSTEQANPTPKPVIQLDMNLFDE